MDNVKNTIAKNITNLRLANNMTQVELGERLNYSDKAVSKWERAESIPDVTVLVEIAKLFGVTLDYDTQKLGNVDHVTLKNTTDLEVTFSKNIFYIS